MYVVICYIAFALVLYVCIFAFKISLTITSMNEMSLKIHSVHTILCNTSIFIIYLLLWLISIDVCVYVNRKQ